MRQPPAQTIAASVTDPSSSATAVKLESYRTPRSWASRWPRLISVNRSMLSVSRPKSCTMRIPETFSWRNEFNRAIIVRARRYAVRI